MLAGEGIDRTRVNPWIGSGPDIRNDRSRRVIHSMTGFGDAAGEVQGVVLSVELRSLNNRYFKATLRLPEDLASLEAQLDAHLRRKIARGSVTLSVKMRRPDAMAAGRINAAVLIDYVRQLQQIKTQSGDVRLAGAEMVQLLGLPGVLESGQDQEQLLATVRPVVLKLVDQAYEKFIAMRRHEGEAVAEDLRGHRRQIAGQLEIVRQRAPFVVEEYHDRLQSRIEELMARARLKVDEIDLIRETAIYAERCDISEEVSRLGGHLEHFDQILDGDGAEPMGRTLEFLAQEMLREANTIASKSNDGQISRATVAMKSSIDRIKEQTQNVE